MDAIEIIKVVNWYKEEKIPFAVTPLQRITIGIEDDKVSLLLF